MKAYVSADVSKDTLDVAVLVAKKIAFKRRFSNNKTGIQQLIKTVTIKFKNYDFLFGCEATGIYHEEFAHMVYEAGYNITVINPRFIHHESEAMGIKSCTDKTDSVVIAFRLAREQDILWTPCDENTEIIRELILRRDQIKKILIAEKSRLERFRKRRHARKSVQRMIGTLKKELVKVENEIRETTQSDEKLKRKTEIAQSVIGVGKLISVSFIATDGDVNRYKNAGQVVSFLGVCPQQKISGTSVRKSYMSHRGNALLRKQLYMGAVAAISKQNVYRTYYEKLVSNGKCKKTALAAVMRKMVRALYAVLRDETPFSSERYGLNPIS